MFKAIFGSSETEQFVKSETNDHSFRNQIPVSQAANNRIMQTPRDSTNKSKMAEVLLNLPPLGLKLHKAPSFMDLIETRLFPEENRPNMSIETNPKKASNADIFLLRIGSWQRVARNKEDLVAKCYFAKRKLMWEILENGLKRKIQMQWDNISAIRADIKENMPGILEVELSQPPSFYFETEPQPKKHTLWDNTSDFTGGQASLCRRHFIQFPPGALDKLYEKLLKHEPRFLQMSQRPFPSLDTPYFESDLYNSGNEISFGFNGNMPQVHSVQESSYQIPFNHVDRDISFDYHPMHYSSPEIPLRPIQVRQNHEYQTLCDQSFFPSSDYSPTSVMDLSLPLDEPNNIESVSNMARWGQRVDNYVNTEERNVIRDEDFGNYNPNSQAFMGNESRFWSYSGVEAEEMSSNNYEYESVVSENSDCRFYSQPISWIEAEDKLAYDNVGPNQTMTQFLGFENSVCPWI